MKNLVCGFACLLVTGCAGLASSDCGADAFALGQRDGRIGATPQADDYARRCGAPVDGEKYHAGWREGYSQRSIPLW